jgi:hypothetical protein
MAQSKKHTLITNQPEMPWARINRLVKLTGIPRSVFLKILRSHPEIRTFTLKTDPLNQSGRRMVFIPDVIAHFAREQEKAASVLKGIKN